MTILCSFQVFAICATLLGISADVEFTELHTSTLFVTTPWYAPKELTQTEVAIELPNLCSVLGSSPYYECEKIVSGIYEKLINACGDKNSNFEKPIIVFNDTAQNKSPMAQKTFYRSSGCNNFIFG